MLGTIYGIPEQTVEERIRQISEVLSMDAFLDNRIEKLSTGQTQRASIARCLVHDPQVYIFDEPTLGLDIISSASIIDFMKRERDRGKTVLYSTHYMEEAEYLCDRILQQLTGRKSAVELRIVGQITDMPFDFDRQEVKEERERGSKRDQSGSSDKNFCQK